VKYTVHVKEVWIRSFTVEADYKEEAIGKAYQAIERGDQELDFDYSHTLDEDTWTVFNLTKGQYE
jgi:hypothetical protein